MRPIQVLASALALSTFSAAWPWPPSLQHIKTIAQENGLYQKRSVQDMSISNLEARQDGGGGNNNNNGGGGGQGGGGGGADNAPPQSSNGAPPPSSGSAPPQSSGGSAQPSSGGSSDASSGASSGSNSAPPPSSGSDSKSDAQTTAPPSSQYTDSIAAGAQPGGINMITPNTQSTATQYYKVDQTITWVWNYTSLSRAPQAIDILATVSGTASGANPSPFTLATNYSFAPTETFTWDTGKYANETSTLPMGMYTLLVYDAGAPDGVSATASPGYLGLYNQFHFGMYPTQSPTALATPYQCATCNSARSSMESLTVTGLVAIVAMTVASFVVFANGFGVA